MRKNLMLIALAAIGLASCKGGFKQADGGLLYDIHTDKSGPTIKEGDFMKLNMVLKTEGDSVIFSTYDQGSPIQTLMPKAPKKGDIAAAFLLLSEGDSATVKLNIDSVVKKGMPKPPGIKGKYLVYLVKVEKIIPRGSLSDVVFNGRITEYVKAESDLMKKGEPAKIEKYLADKHITATKTASGLRYQITKPGSGPNIVLGDTVVVNYTGSTFNGKIFDSSVKADAEKAAAAMKVPLDPRRKYEPIHVRVGFDNVIAGWQEGLQLLNKGAEATLVIPSDIAFGDRGAPQAGIPAFAPVAFTVQIVNIIKPKPGTPTTPPTAAAPVQ